MKRPRPDDTDETCTDHEVCDPASDASHDSSDEDSSSDWEDRPIVAGTPAAGPTYTHFPTSCEWERTPEMREKKRRHQDRLDALLEGDREAHIYETVLKGRDMCLEANMFPYECDEGISHWTLWSRRDLRHNEIVKYVTKWCQDAPWVSEWSYEENFHLSFDIPHVHVFFRRASGSSQTVDAIDDELPASPETSRPPRKRRKRWDVAPSDWQTVQ